MDLRIQVFNAIVNKLQEESDKDVLPYWIFEYGSLTLKTLNQDYVSWVIAFDCVSRNPDSTSDIYEKYHLDVSYSTVAGESEVWIQARAEVPSPTGRKGFECHELVSLTQPTAIATHAVNKLLEVIETTYDNEG